MSSSKWIDSIYRPITLQANKLDFSHSWRGSIKLVLCSPTLPLLQKEMYERGVVLSQGLTGLTAPTRNLHLGKYLKNAESSTHSETRDKCLNGLTDHTVSLFRDQTPLCSANTSISDRGQREKYRRCKVQWATTLCEKRKSTNYLLGRLGAGGLWRMWDMFGRSSTALPCYTSSMSSSHGGEIKPKCLLK